MFMTSNGCVSYLWVKMVPRSRLTPELGVSAVAIATTKVQHGAISMRFLKTRKRRASRVRARAVEGITTRKMGCTRKQ